MKLGYQREDTERDLVTFDTGGRCDLGVVFALIQRPRTRQKFYE